jgi:Complex 1 protein (LYR family)
MDIPTLDPLESAPHLHKGLGTIDELLDHYFAKNDPQRGSNDNDESLWHSLTRTRREVLSLYFDILRALRFFIWPDARWVLWREVLRESVRKEFEEARFETNQVVMRLLRRLSGAREGDELIGLWSGFSCYSSLLTLLRYLSPQCNAIEFN